MPHSIPVRLEEPDRPLDRLQASAAPPLVDDLRRRVQEDDRGEEEELREDRTLRPGHQLDEQRGDPVHEEEVRHRPEVRADAAPELVELHLRLRHHLAQEVEVAARRGRPDDPHHERAEPSQRADDQPGEELVGLQEADGQKQRPGVLPDAGQGLPERVGVDAEVHGQDVHGTGPDHVIRGVTMPP